MLRLLAFVFSLAVANAEFAALCEDMLPFCTDAGGQMFAAGLDNVNMNEEGIDYGCLNTWPNSAWYYMQIEDSGDMIIDMASADGEDIDFALWGRWNSLDEARAACGPALGSPIDCSYDPRPDEDATLTGANTGEFYVFVITNYANVPNTIGFTKRSGSGTATTNCDVLLTCDTNPAVNVGYSADNCVGAAYGDECSISCSAGYAPVGMVAPAVCESGEWQWEGTVDNGCVDINECSSNTDYNCGDYSYCINTAGSYYCECDPGFYNVMSNPYTCADIDECATGANNCGTRATCFNTIGSYYCECEAGYEYDGYPDTYTCSDIDECALGIDSCPLRSDCFNTDGAYYCVCHVGYDGEYCLDIDECALQLDECSMYADCMNTYGSYECECWEGYSGDGYDCEFIALPSASPVPVVEEKCVNTEEVYTETNIEFAYIFRGLKVKPRVEKRVMMNI
jgi:hypothetical protein